MVDIFNQISLYDIFGYFIIYAFAGWCLEVVFCSVNTGKFVNRGFLLGPVCPIYGFGATAVIVLLTPISHNILLLYIASVVICSTLELIVGYLLKRIFKSSWWDYSDQPFNIGGYVCLKFSLLWGIACLLLMRVIHPLVNKFLNLLPQQLGWAMLAILYGALIADVVLSVISVNKLNRDLGEISKFADKLHAPSELMAKSIGNTAISVAEKIDKLEIDVKKEGFAQRLEDEKSRFTTYKKLTEDKIKDLLGSKPQKHDRLLRAFPNMKSVSFNEALDQLKNIRKLNTPKNDEDSNV